MNIRTKTK